MDAVHIKTMLNTIGSDAKRLRTASTIALVCGMTLILVLGLSRRNDSSSGPVLSLSRLSYLQSLVGTLRASPQANVRERSFQSVTPRDLRGLFALDFENLKYEMKELGLLSTQEWQDFANAWQRAKNQNDVQTVRGLLTEPTHSLVRVLATQEGEGSAEVSDLGRTLTWLAALGLVGSAYLLMRRVVSLTKAKRIERVVQNNENTSRSDDEHTLLLLQSALRTPMTALANQAKGALEFASRAETQLLQPIEATLFENPLQNEKIATALRDVRELRRKLAEIIRTQDSMTSVVQQFESLNPAALEDEREEIEIADYVQEVVSGVTSSAEEDGVSLEFVLRSDSPLCLVNKEALRIVLSNLLFDCVATVRSSHTSDKRILVSLWSSHAFWQKFSPEELLPLDLSERSEANINSHQKDPGFVVVVADTADLRNEDSSEIRLSFATEVLSRHKAFTWKSRSEVEPGEYLSQLVVFWPS